MAIVATCLLVAIGVLAGASAGSSPRGPRATAPKLLVHDVSGFGGKKKHAAARPGPQAFKVYNDTVASDSDSTVLNTSGDIGISQYVWALNGTYGIFSRVGSSSLASVSSANFWSGLSGPDAAGLCSTNPQGESSVAYDQLADRWVIAEAAYAGGASPVAPFVECVAVSTSADATGTWNRYVFQVSSTLFPNLPTLGVWSDGYYLSFNQHTASGTWAGAGALALERAKMLTGAAAQSRYFDLEGVTPGLGGMLPANINGPIAPLANAPELYLQAHDDPLNHSDRLELWDLHVDWTPGSTTSTFTPAVSILTNPGGLGFNVDTEFSCPESPTLYWSTCMAQGGLGGPLEPLAQAYSDKPLDPNLVGADAYDALPQLGGRLQWNRTPGGTESLAAVETVNDGNSVADPAWFKLTNIGGAGWNIGAGAKGIYNAADGNSRFLPSVALDNNGNVGLAYALTGVDGGPLPGGGTTPSYDSALGYTEATSGSYNQDHVLANGTPYTLGDTWGRDTTLSLDPIDGCTFWFFGPYQDSSLVDDGWIDHFSFPSDCTASATQPPLLTGDPSWSQPIVREGYIITGNHATFTGATSYTYQWRLCDSRGLNCVDITGANGTMALPTDPEFHTITAAEAIGDRTLRYQETATNASNVSSTSVSLPTAIVQSIPPQNVTRPVISGTAQAGQTLSTTDGAWTSSSPKSYTYRWRRCAGSVCTDIPGATSSTYALTAADVGSPVDVVVTAVNTGGGTDAIADATVTVVAAPPSSGGSGGSGGGSSGGGSSGGGSSGGSGGAGSPDLAVIGTTSSVTPNVGDNVTFFLTVTDKNLKPAQGLYVNITLPAGLQFVSSSADRGSACTAVSTSALKCFLDWLSSGVPAGHLQVVTKVTVDGAQTLTATATSQQGVSSAADSTVSLTVNQAGSTTTTTTTTTSSSTAGIPTGLNGSGTTAKAKSDKKAPTSTAIASTGKRGATVKLRFRIYDDLGVAKALATIKRNGKSFATEKTGFGPVAFGTTYFLGWHVPALAPKGTYRFCVVAVDRAGNHSRSSCAALKLK